MNSVKFNQSGGFPWDTNVFDFAQKAWGIFNTLGAVVGDLAIIQGCDVVGTTASNGVVYINGEILEFRGGNVSTNVIIVETAVQLEFEDSTTKDVEITRYATFGTATTQYDWANFKKSMTLLEVTTAIALMATKLGTIATGAEVNVKPDWNAAAGSAAEIFNKPSIVSPFLYKGVFEDLNPYSDSIFTINFPTVGTSNYIVVGSLVSKGANYDLDNDVIWMVREKAATSFKIVLREIAPETQNLDFNYVLIPL